MYRLLAFALLLGVVSACVPSIMVQTQRDTAYQLKKNTPIYLELKDDVSISEKNVYNLLRNALARSGFQVADSADKAEVILTFSIDDKQYAYEGYQAYPYYYYGAWPHYQPWYYGPYWYAPPPIYIREATVVKLRLFEKANYGLGKRQPVWEGSVYGDRNTLEDRLQQALNFLVDKIGSDYRGGVRVHDAS